MRLGICAAVLVLIASACSSSELEVAMADQRFEPETITVSVGETVTFVNEDGEQHTVTAVEDSIPDDAEYFASGGFESEREARESLSEGLLAQGETFEVTLEVPGTYEFFCIPHEQSGMRGTIEVEESS
ncbi:MAG: cupredoxin domain-containing protein [Actinomycetota bacterium]